MDWLADFKIEADLALQLIREQFPTLEIHSFATYGHGWDNIAFIVNNTDIFRFPRRGIALAGSTPNSVHDTILFDECQRGIKYIIESILNY